MTAAVFAWSEPPMELQLADDEVHVWCGMFDPASDRPRALEALSADERIRAARFRFARDRRWFIARRFMLRSVLGEYLHVSPAHIHFDYGAHGKPELGRDDFPLLPVEFSLSHSSGLAVCAVTRGRRVGIDVEHVRVLADVERLVERFFSPDEQARFHALPSSSRQEAFFECWTRKEAYLKATGAGLSVPLDGFTVSFGPQAPRLLEVCGSPSEVDQWSFRTLSPATQFTTALFVAGAGLRVSCYRWPDPTDQGRLQDVEAHTHD